MRSAILFLVFVCVSFIVSAQDTTQKMITVTGQIKDEQKAPLPGASVTIKGTSIGTVTDEKGNFSLQVPQGTGKLQVSYIGYSNNEIILTSGGGPYSLSLASGDISMNQVVVSASRRSEKLIDAPASVSVLGTEELEKNLVTTPVDQLKNTAGVDLIKTGLVSSDVVIRGFNNIFSGVTLNVVDDRIGSVPSLQVNAYQLVPSDPMDYEKIEVVQGPASALYGPNASNGVIHIITKSPLDQKNQFETTLAMTGGVTVLAKSYQQYNGGNPFSGNIINPEIRHSGKLLKGKLGYKISGAYFQGQDYPNYDAREPNKGDSLIFGTVKNGVVWQPDTLGYTTVYDTAKHRYDTSAKYDVRRFNKDFSIRKWNIDARVDIRPINDLTITISGGVANTHNIELTGLGAAQGGGATGGWTYWYFQTRLKWKKLFIQYYINASNSGNTYLIPQISASGRNTYNSTSPPTPYQVQLLVDRSRLEVFQIQHSWAPIEKLNFVYGIDVLITQPNTEGTINGLFENIDNLTQAGGYIQGDYSIFTWMKLVGAVRVDYNSIIKNVAASPRGAVVFTLAQNQTLRVTYNRAFDSPNTLEEFLDLSNGVIPNGINIRGIGNPYGWNYQYDQTGAIQFRTAPYGNPAGTQLVTFNDPSYNVQALTNIIGLLSSANPALAQLLPTLFNGITGTNGTVAHATQTAIDYANFAQTGNFPGSIVNVNSFRNLSKLNNQYTQTVEIGYKGLLFKKLSLDVNAYWTRISNYTSALTSASAAVLLNTASYLGPPNSTGVLWQNIEKLKTAFPQPYEALYQALSSNPSLTNKTIATPDSTTIWSELVVLMDQLPIGTVTPNSSKYIGSDFILTYQNLGRLDVFGADLSAQYLVYEDMRNKFNVGITASWIDRDQFTLTSGENVPLNSPKVMAGVTYDHKLKLIGFGYGLSFRYQNGYYGSSAIYSGQVSPAYILDLRASYRLKTFQNLLLSLNVNDLNNYQWSSFPGAPLMGMQIYGRAQLTF